MRGEGLQGLCLVRRGGFGPGRDGAVKEAKILVRNNHSRVDLKLLAESVARGARAEGVVEGEQTRLDFRYREAGDRTGKVGTEIYAPGLGLAGLEIGILGDGDALGKTESRLEAFGEALLHAFAHNDPIDDHINVVLEFLV